MHLPGLEPGLQAWKARILPLDHKCRLYSISSCSTKEREVIREVILTIMPLAPFVLDYAPFGVWSGAYAAVPTWVIALWFLCGLRCVCVHLSLCGFSFLVGELCVCGNRAGVWAVFVFSSVCSECDVVGFWCELGLCLCLFLSFLVWVSCVFAVCSE